MAKQPQIRRHGNAVDVVNSAPRREALNRILAIKRELQDVRYELNMIEDHIALHVIDQHLEKIEKREATLRHLLGQLF